MGNESSINPDAEEPQRKTSGVRRKKSHSLVSNIPSTSRSTIAGHSPYLIKRPSRLGVNKELSDIKESSPVNPDAEQPHHKTSGFRPKSQSLVSNIPSTTTSTGGGFSPYPDKPSGRLRGGRTLSDIKKSSDFGLSLSDTLSLTSYHRQILAQTWPKIQAPGSGGGNPSVAFRILSDKSSAAKTLFQKSSILSAFLHPASNRVTHIKEHGRLTAELVGFAIGNMDEPARTTSEKCKEIGLAHCPLNVHGFTNSIWDRFGEVLVEYILKSEPVRKYRGEGTKAWGALISYLVDNMKNGYQTEIRRRRSSNSLRVEQREFKRDQPRKVQKSLTVE